MSATEYVSTAVTALVAMAVALLLDYVARPAESRHLSSYRPPGWFTWWAYAAALFSTCVLAATALYGMAVHGNVRRWTLLIHVAAAGVLLPTLMVVALGWSRWALHPPSKQPVEPGQRRRFLARWQWAYWSALLAGVITAGTMLISMVPVLDSRGLSLMLTIHAYSGLVCFVALVIHAYCLLTARWGRP